MIQRAALVGLALLYLVVGALFATQTPPWQAPDEPAHYNYIRQLATGGCCPVIEDGDWQQEYQSQLTAARFAPQLLNRLNTIQYEDHQPPLYYLLTAPVYRLSEGSLIALRLFSVLIGAGVVLGVYALGRVVVPGRPWVALAAAAFVAFLPQHVAVLASVNNDGLAELLVVWTMVLMVAWVLGHRVPAWVLGVLVGLIFVTKSTGYFMAGLVPLAILLRWWLDGTRRPVDVLRPLALFLVPALVMGLLWWGRNIAVYGFPDFLGLAAHDRVVADQLRTADYMESVGGFGPYLSHAVQTTFNSFWGQFGWMALPLQPWMYTAFMGLLLVAGGGLVIAPRQPTDAAQRAVWLLLGLALILALAAFVFYNSEFVQFQGRYLYPGLAPLALLLALGLDGWRQRFAPGLPWLPFAVFLLLAPLNIYLVLWVIAPLLAP